MKIPGLNTIKTQQPNKDIKKVAAAVVVGETAVLYGADKFIKSKNNG